MSDVELRDEMMTLLLAGHETSATALAWAIHHLLANPDALAAVKAEIHGVAGSGPIQPEQAAKLELLDAAIKETMRLTPIVVIVGRKLMRPMTIGGRDLPAGAVAVACIYLAHRRPDSWAEPERFRPERFLGKKLDPYEYIPFGGGARRCIGMAFATYEMKIVLAEVLSRVTLRAAPGPAVKAVRRGITFAPSGGTPVIVEDRVDPTVGGLIRS
jgi:cytochrome P450